MKTTNEGFVVLELRFDTILNYRIWLFSSDVDAFNFRDNMAARFINNTYKAMRANVAEYEE